MVVNFCFTCLLPMFSGHYRGCALVNHSSHSQPIGVKACLQGSRLARIEGNAKCWERDGRDSTVEPRYRIGKRTIRLGALSTFICHRETPIFGHRCTLFRCSSSPLSRQPGSSPRSCRAFLPNMCAAHARTPSNADQCVGGHPTAQLPWAQVTLGLESQCSRGTAGEEKGGLGWSGQPTTSGARVGLLCVC